MLTEQMAAAGIISSKPFEAKRQDYASGAEMKLHTYTHTRARARTHTHTHLRSGKAGLRDRSRDQAEAQGSARGPKLSTLCYAHAARGIVEDRP